jgi:hypothetical protein
LLHLCSTLFLYSFGASKYFLVRKIYQETGGICSYPKVAMFEIYEAKARCANLVVILDILLVWLGYAFYRAGGSSWIFWM